MFCREEERGFKYCRRPGLVPVWSSEFYLRKSRFEKFVSSSISLNSGRAISPAFYRAQVHYSTGTTAGNVYTLCTGHNTYSRPAQQIGSTYIELMCYEGASLPFDGSLSATENKQVALGGAGVRQVQASASPPITCSWYCCTEKRELVTTCTIIKLCPLAKETRRFSVSRGRPTAHLHGRDKLPSLPCCCTG